MIQSIPSAFDFVLHAVCGGCIALICSDIFTDLHGMGMGLSSLLFDPAIFRSCQIDSYSHALLKGSAIDCTRPGRLVTDVPADQSFCNFLLYAPCSLCINCSIAWLPNPLARMQTFTYCNVHSYIPCAPVPCKQYPLLQKLWSSKLVFMVLHMH